MVAAAVSTMPNPKRPPLLRSDDDNGVVGPRLPKSRGVTSRYLCSPSPSSTTTSTSATSSSYSSSSNSSSSRPLVSRTSPMTPVSASSAAITRSKSAERRRPATWPNPGEMSAVAKLLATSRRSLSVSFQGESFSLPISKAKPAPAPVTNNLSSTRKGTPERRKAAPVRDQTEKSKPIDLHRWPGRLREVNSLTRSLDFTGEKKESGGSGSMVRVLEQSMIDESRKPSFNGRLKLQSTNAELDKAFKLVNDANSAVRSAATSDPVDSDIESVSSGSTGRGGPCGVALMKKSFIDSPISSSRVVSSSRGSSSPLRGPVRPASPSKLVTSPASSPSRGMPSPSRVRNGVASMLSNDLSNTPSILSFAAEVRRGKVGENRVVDAHMLRLLYNRHLQWRFVNARGAAAMLVQKITAEKSLYNAWVTTLKLRHTVKSKRVELQLLRQSLKMYSILKGQMLYLDDWDFVDADYSSSLSVAIEALECSTLQLPVVDGARTDIQSVKDAICSAVDVMQAMASSICTFLTKADEVNSLVSELSNITSKEHALLNQCKDLLSTLTAMQVKDCSLKTHILQLCHEPSSLTTEVKKDDLN